MMGHPALAGGRNDIVELATFDQIADVGLAFGQPADHLGGDIVFVENQGSADGTVDGKAHFMELATDLGEFRLADVLALAAAAAAAATAAAKLAGTVWSSCC